MKSKPRLIAIYITNFLGVLDDNLLKSLISLLAVTWMGQGMESTVIMLAAAFMVVPFILFSPYAGYISKKVNKPRFVVFLKSAEVLIMALASFGFWIENIYVVLTAMFIMGLQSTFFSPVKFALVRDIGGEEKSSIGTGTIEMTTFFGVLFGTFLAGVLGDIEQNGFYWITGSFAGITILGVLNALSIRANEPKPLTLRIPPLNFVSFLIRKVRWSRRSAPGLNDVVVGLSMFWLIASLIQMNLFIHCPITLGMSLTQTGITLALVAVAIGLGSFLSGVMSGDTVKPALIPIGGVGFILSLLALFVFNPAGILFTVLIMIAAFMAGLMKTPLNAWMQVNVKGRKLGDAIAYNNLVNFIFILASALIFGVAESVLGTRFVFLIVTVLSALMVIHLVFAMKGMKESVMDFFRMRRKEE